MLFGTATRKVFFLFKYIEICLKSPKKQQKYLKYRLNQIYPSSLRLSTLKTRPKALMAWNFMFIVIERCARRATMTSQYDVIDNVLMKESMDALQH